MTSPGDQPPTTLEVLASHGFAPSSPDAVRRARVALDRLTPEELAATQEQRHQVILEWAGLAT